MSDGKIYITISDTRGGGGGVAPTPQPQVTPSTPETGKSEGQAGVILRYAEHQFFNFVKSQTTKLINAGISNIGNYTGNYALQDDVNLMMSSLSSLRGIGVSVIAGAKIGGPVGAAVGATFGIAAQEVSFQLQEKLNRFQNYKLNKQIDKLRIRSGLDASTNGSRGTEG